MKESFKMKLTTEKLTQIIREEVENVANEASYRVGGRRDPMRMAQRGRYRRGREDDEYIGDPDGSKELMRNAKRRLQNGISQFVWGEDGIIGQVAQWMNDTMSEKYPEKHETLPAGYESPTQIANTEFGKVVLADDSLQQLLKSAVNGQMNLSALNRAVRQISGLSDIEEYADLEALGEDAAAFIAMDILRYLDMKLA